MEDGGEVQVVEEANEGRALSMRVPAAKVREAAERRKGKVKEEGGRGRKGREEDGGG